ncbi:MAG: PAS domain S-box protein [Pedobacter sp.]|nr:MAG: PAS domain S-box protein [Pedobacter sp.]
MVDSIESERIKEVKKYLELNINNSSEFQDIVNLASQLCEKPVALITFLDEESNWLRVRTGTDIEVMPRETSFCQYAVNQDDLMIVEDATKDPRFVDNPLVTNDPNLRFYAGAPLVLNNGTKLGNLCLFDRKPNELSEAQQKILPVLARQVTYILELEMSRNELRKQIEQTEAKNIALINIAQLQSHQIRQPLTTLMGLTNLIKDDLLNVDEEWLDLFRNATENFDQVIHGIIAETVASKDLRAIRFNKMVEEIDDYAILLLDENGNIENWNKGAQKIKGYSSEEIIGKNFSIFYTNEDNKNEKPNKLIGEAKDKGVARDEGWRIRKDGTKFWGNVVITAIHNDLGIVIGFTKVTRDLTAIIDAQEAENFSTEMFNQIIQQTKKSARVGGWELDLRNNKLSWTTATKEIHGVGEKYIPILENVIKFYKEGNSRNRIMEAVNLAIQEGMSWDLELEMVTNNGNEIWIHTIGKSNYRDGICTKVYGTCQDISDSKLLK